MAYRAVCLATHAQHEAGEDGMTVMRNRKELNGSREEPRAFVPAYLIFLASQKNKFLDSVDTWVGFCDAYLIKSSRMSSAPCISHEPREPRGTDNNRQSCSPAC